MSTGYQSEFTQWMDQMMQDNPQWHQDQVSGRALWWDKLQNETLCAGYQQAEEPLKAYPYDVFFDEN